MLLLKEAFYISSPLPN